MVVEAMVGLDQQTATSPDEPISLGCPSSTARLGDAAHPIAEPILTVRDVDANRVPVSF